MASLALYLIVFIFGTLFLKQASIKKKSFITPAIIGFTIIILFAAGRYHVGTDMGTYTHMFERYLTSDWNAIFSESSEYLFLFIAKITYAIGGRVLTWGTFAALTAIPTFLALSDEYPKTSFGIAFFTFLCAYYSTSFNITRQMVSVALIFWGIKYIFRDQPCRFILLVIVATGFHTAALLAIPMWILWDHRNSISIKGQKRLGVLIIIAVVVAFYQFFITRLSAGVDFFSRFDSFAISDNRGRNRDFYVYLFELIIVLMFRRRLVLIDERNDFFISLLVISVLIDITGFSHPQVKRIAFFYAMPARMVLAGYLPQCSTGGNAKIIRVMTYIWVSMLFVLTTYVLRESNLIPYHFNLFSEY